MFVPMILTWRKLVLSRQTGLSMAEAKRAYGELFWQSLASVPTWVKVESVLCCIYSTAMGMAVGVVGGQDELIRLFSGGWMLFYLIPAVFFFWVEPGAQGNPGNTQHRPAAASARGGKAWRLTTTPVIGNNPREVHEHARNSTRCPKTGASLVSVQPTVAAYRSHRILRAHGRQHAFVFGQVSRSCFDF